MSERRNDKSYTLILGALGIVYGDLGTSPLYALQQILNHETLTQTNVFGVLSLVFWSLVLVISTCYVSVFLKANNDGEGGVLALLALLKRKTARLPRFIFYMAIFGAGLLLGDGMITPAISVLSAIEGLEMISPDFSHLIVPISFVILFCLFVCQRYGTGRISVFFGPIILLWFITIATLGALAILEMPEILRAINPYYAWHFLHAGGWHAYVALSSVFLVITGAEAMYADLAHFGKSPIRKGWFMVALPALLLNYFGQGANVLSHHDAMSNLFFALSPAWFVIPLLVIATLATIIASQAVISASFSLVKQAILLELCPRFLIKHTSEKETGQVYISEINYVLATGTLLLVGVFHSSTGLSAAFGMAVNLVMLIVAVLILYVAKYVWSWSHTKICFVFLPLIVIDCLFLGANSHKIYEGAWIPLVFAGCVSFVMLAWRNGMLLIRRSYHSKIPLTDTIKQLERAKLSHAEDLTMVFITDAYDNSGGGFLNYIKLNHILPKQTLIVSVIIETYPYVKERDCFQVEKLAEGFYQVILHYGFMQSINIPRMLKLAVKRQFFSFTLDISHVTYVVQTINVSSASGKQTRFFQWQRYLFRFLLRNSTLDSEFFHLPRNQTLSTGGYV